MSEHLDSIDDPSADEIAALARLLARDDVWHEPTPGIEDEIVATIRAEADPQPVALDDRRRERARVPSMPWWLAAAAVVAIVVAGLVIVTRDSGNDGGDLQFALAGTDAAPGASAAVTVAATPAGLKILLDADGLDPAPDGFFYETWLSNGTLRVSAGSFHLRGGDGPIELWAGVVEPDFDRLAVTLEPLDGNTDSSGDVRLSGRFDLASG